MQTKKIEIDKIKRIDIYQNKYEKELGYTGFKGQVMLLRNQFPILKIQNTGRLDIVYDKFNHYRILNGLSLEQGIEIQKIIMNEICC